MKEIGGYIEFEHLDGREYHPNALALNSASRAMEYLLRSKKIKKVYLPILMCGCIKRICDQFGVQVAYYPVDSTLKPLFTNVLQNGEWLYLVNYYGQLSNNQIAQYKAKYGNVIVDNVQAFFQKPCEGTDTLYSCRKFFGVPDGGYLYTDQVLPEELPLNLPQEMVAVIFPS